MLTDYYNILERHHGDWSKATKEEMLSAFRENPNDPPTARRIAQEKWHSKHYACEEVGAPWCQCQKNNSSVAEVSTRNLTSQMRKANRNL